MGNPIDPAFPSGRVELPWYNLQNGERYYIVHQSETQRKPRVSVMDYMDQNDNSYFFSARPVAGTQEIPKRDVKRVHKVSSGHSIVLNKIVSGNA